MVQQYLTNHMRAYGKQAIGFAFFLAWNYFSFFSCGLVPIIRVIRSSERYWMWTGLFLALAALALMVLSARRPLVRRKTFGVAAALVSAVGTLVIWTSFLGDSWRMVSALGGMVAGVGFAMMALVWGDRLSSHNEAAIEFSAPASFILSFFIYFVLLALKGPASMIVDAALPVLSMYFAFRSAGYPEKEAAAAGFDADRRLGGRELVRAVAGILTLCLLFGMLWFQFAYFRLLSTPEMVSDRFMHYLVPFSCSFVLSIVALVSCIKLSRYLNFTLMFRWGLPLLLLSYALLYYSYDDPLQRIVAYTVNFVGMFGVQFSFWMAAPKYVRRSGMPPYVLFGCLLAGEGLGVFLGTGYGLVVIDGVTAANVMHESLLFFVAVLLVAMVVGFNPRWSFFRTSGRWATHAGDDGDEADDGGSAADEIALLFVRQAEELQRVYGLSSRETEVAALMLAGRSRPYIRDELIISLNTVHSHVGNIYAKCGVHSQREFMDLMDAAKRGERPTSDDAAA